MHFAVINVFNSHIIILVTDVSHRSVDIMNNPPKKLGFLLSHRKRVSPSRAQNPNLLFSGPEIRLWSQEVTQKVTERTKILMI